MAEAIVSAVVQSLSSLLIDQTISFSTSFTDVYEQFELLQKELISIQGFLKSADSNHNQDPGIYIWVSDVRDIAYDVDDVIDSFLRKISYKEEGESSNKFLKRCVRKPKKIFDSYKLVKEMEKIFSKIKEISERRKRYSGITSEQTNPSTSTNNRMLRRVYSHIKDDVTIGLKEQTNSLVSELLKEEDRLCVVSIYGMGGLGKTTLAKKVYNHNNIKTHFDCFGWTSISQQLNARDVLKEILRKVSTLTSKDMGEMNEEELVGKLSRILEGKRYLVVLDDMWNTKDWDILKPAFPNSKGSKVMITTRNQGVAKHADPGSCHFEPRCLTDDEAWELLCSKALLPPYVTSSNLPLSSDLEESGRTMVKKCGGLPLAIIVLGGMLQVKRSLGEWENVSKKIGISGDPVLSILSLSYNELPYHLKPLFLYLGIFPEDSDIRVKRLVRMWMAERLIKNQEGETIEELGIQYLDELVHRCMVQMGEKSLGREGAKTCRLHDKMRDLCIDIGKKENFFEVISHQNSDSGSKLRRCAIYVEEEKEKGKPFVFPKQITPSLRTAVFIPKVSLSDYCPNIMYKDFKSVKVLEFQGKLLDSDVGGVVKKLSNLRYLCVQSEYIFDPTNYDHLIGNMVCVETLDLGADGRIDKRMGEVISKVMHQLRYLNGYDIQVSKINKMTKLQTLNGVGAGAWITDLVKLKNLKKLGIIKLTEETMGLLTDVIGGDGLDKLGSLVVNGELLSTDLLETLTGKHDLQKLWLSGRIKKLPSQLPSNLIKLKIDMAYFSKDPMPTIENLQHLLFLELFWDSYSGKKMVCSAKGFPKLKRLRISELLELEEWTVEEGAMPYLNKCLIDKCPNLKMIPQGFKFLKMLQDLRIAGMPELFEKRVKEGGQDWQTIQHIPSVIIINDP